MIGMTSLYYNSPNNHTSNYHIKSYQTCYSITNYYPNHYYHTLNYHNHKLGQRTVLYPQRNLLLLA